MPKFLIIRFSSIGDIVLTTPVIRCLKQQVPGAEVHFLTKPSFKTILEYNPYIDKLHVLDKSLIQKAQELKNEGFDYIIDLHHNLRTRILKGLLDIPAFSFDKLNAEKMLLVQTGINTLPAVHITQRYLQTLESVGIRNDGKGLDYFFPPDFKPNNVPALPEKFVAFAIGAQHGTKRLPNHKIVDICKGITLPVVLLGGKEDYTNGEAIVQQAGARVINYCGKGSLHESAYVLSKAYKVITHDTGLMHIAAALQKDIIAIWGNTIPEFGMSAYLGENNTQTTIPVNHEVHGLSCRPCSKIGYRVCPKQHFNCMEQQDVQKITDSVNP